MSYLNVIVYYSQSFFCALCVELYIIECCLLTIATNRFWGAVVFSELCTSFSLVEIVVYQN